MYRDREMGTYRDRKKAIETERERAMEIGNNVSIVMSRRKFNNCIKHRANIIQKRVNSNVNPVKLDPIVLPLGKYRHSLPLSLSLALQYYTIHCTILYYYL